MSSYRITSEVDIVITAYNEEYLSQDSYTVLPVTRLDHVYYVMSYSPSSLHTQFAIVASKDDTHVNIEFKSTPVAVHLNGELLNKSSHFTMRQYEALQLQVCIPTSKHYFA